MMHHSLRRSLAYAILSLGASAASADTIYLVSGDVLGDVKISAETFKEIAYRDGSKKKTIKTEKVLKVEFSAKSQLVDRADSAAGDGQVYDAISDLEVYLDGLFSSGHRPRYNWEPAYAMFRLIELNRVVGDAEHLIAAADQLISKAPESRYVPLAFLAKAEAQYLTGKGPGAKKTLDAFQNLIQAKSLPAKWQMEQKLASVIFDSSLKGKALRAKLETISSQAGSQYPVVANRADVAIAESLLESDKPANLKDAEAIFLDITLNPKADSRTLAAAYTGLGDCVFKRAMANSGDLKLKLLQDAKLAYMRVVVVYKGETNYAPKALYWAGRVFDASGEPEDKDRAQKLYLRVMREYKGSTWADQANALRRR